MALGRVKRHLNIDPAEIIRSDAVQDKPDISNLLSRAVDAGIVSEDEAEDMELADIIIRGQDPDEATVYAVVVGEAAASANLEFAELAKVTFFRLMERKDRRRK